MKKSRNGSKVKRAKKVRSGEKMLGSGLARGAATGIKRYRERLRNI